MSSAPSSPIPPLPRTLGTRGVFIAAVALVVSASTLVSDFTGFATLGGGFALSVVVGMLVVLPVVISTTDLAVAHPRAGGIYRYARSVMRGRRGRTTGLFLALLFSGTFLFGAAGETMAGAHALRSLMGLEVPVAFCVVAIALTGIIPNLFGLRSATWFTGILLVIMLGIRWYFGLSGFFGWSDTGPWEAANLRVEYGPDGGALLKLLMQGLAFGFWSFVGIEGACSLVEETRRPERSLPRGLFLGLLAILATTLVTGLGALGGLPMVEWRELMAGPAGAAGEAPHLAVGAAMHGTFGRTLMAVATVASTLSTLLIAFAAMPRMIRALARDRMLASGLGRFLERSHPRTGAPWAATLVVGSLYLGLTLVSGAVVDCLYAAAYLWFFRHLILHGLAWINRSRTGGRSGAFGRTFLLTNASIGVVATGVAFVVSFSGMHAEFGLRALLVATVAGLLTWVSRTRRAHLSRRPREFRGCKHLLRTSESLLCSRQVVLMGRERRPLLRAPAVSTPVTLHELYSHR